MQLFLYLPCEQHRIRVLQWCQDFEFEVLDLPAGIQFFVRKELSVIKFILRHLSIPHQVHSYY